MAALRVDLDVHTVRDDLNALSPPFDHACGKERCGHNDDIGREEDLAVVRDVGLRAVLRVGELVRRVLGVQTPEPIVYVVDDDLAVVACSRDGIFKSSVHVALEHDDGTVKMRTLVK